MLPDIKFKNYRILVVDDEQRMAKFIRLNLEHDGFRVVEAFTGTQALDRLRTSLPDLVLLDVMLPDLDGFEVLKLIRAISRYP
jgi:two-component system KDP operon response regulator KdpE